MAVFAICQTAHAPGSPDSNRHILFDLAVGATDSDDHYECAIEQ